MKRLLILPIIAVVLPGGCVSADQAVPNVQYKPVYIDHPVACVAESDIWPRPDVLPANQHDARKNEPILLSKVREWERYADHNDPKLHACATAADMQPVSTK